MLVVKGKGCDVPLVRYHTVSGNNLNYFPQNMHTFLCVLCFVVSTSSVWIHIMYLFNGSPLLMGQS